MRKTCIGPLLSGRSGMLGCAPMSHESYHEPLELLSQETRNMHRAIVSLGEELEAVDWYHPAVPAGVGLGIGSLRASL